MTGRIVKAILVDTGFLLSLFRPTDRLRPQAREFLRQNRRPLITISPAIVETCFFLDAPGKLKLLEWVRRGALAVVDVPIEAYAELQAILRKYADRDIDFAGAAFLWLANRMSLREILTVDESDFSIYRLKAGKRFTLLSWFD